jgi:hypothetical protein
MTEQVASTEPDDLGTATPMPWIFTLVLWIPVFAVFVWFFSRYSRRGPPPEP